MTARLQAAGLSFAFSDAAPIVDAASFVLSAGTTGLVGENGAGKSTLLRVLAGEHLPRAGRVRIEPPGARVVLCEQELHVPSVSLEAFAERSDRAAQRLRSRLALDTWDLRRFATLSPGERKRWQLGAALGEDPDVLLLDEPTNHLDAAGRGWLVQALTRSRVVCVIVSHDRALLDQITTHTLRLHRGRATLYAGGYEAARTQWLREAELQRAEHDRLCAAVARSTQRLHEAHQAQRGAAAQRSTRNRMRNAHDSDARTLGARARVDWAEARHGRSAQLARRALDAAEAALASHASSAELGGKISARVQASVRKLVLFRPEGPLRAGDEHAADAPVLLALPALHLRSSDRVLLCGDNGAGKSTLLRSLLSCSNVAREDLLVLPQELSAAEADCDLARVRAAAPAERGAILSYVAALGVDPARLLASSQPSPGEARKLRIALGLGRAACALVLDEPENHLDLPSIERLESALCAYPGALLLVTHDAALAARCTSTRWQLSRDGLAVS